MNITSAVLTFDKHFLYNHNILTIQELGMKHDIKNFESQLFPSVI